MIRPDVKKTLVELGFYLALTVATTWPLILHPASSYAGGARTDAPNAIWSLWFVGDAIQEERLPLTTHLLNHPLGGRLMVADPLNALLLSPVVILLGPVVAYTLLVVGHLTFAGMAAHRLGERLGGSGWIAGVGYASAPLLLSHVQNGSSEAISAGWMPFGVLMMVRAIEEGGWKRILWGGVGLFLGALGAGWYAGVGMFVLVGCIGILGWGGLSYRTLWSRLGPVMALGLVLAAPAAVGIKSVAVAEDGLVEIKNPEDLERLRRTLGAADPRTLVLPGNFASPDFRNLEGNPSDRFHTIYLGYMLAMLACFSLWRGRFEGALVAALGIGLVLSLGPVLVLGGFPAAYLGRAFPLPYALIEAFPGFSSLSLLYRLAGVSALCLALLADKARPAMAILVLVEVWLLSPARTFPDVTPLPPMTAAQILAELPPGAVMNLPVVPGRNFLYEQILHHKPLVGSLNTSVNLQGLRVLSVARKLRMEKTSKEELIKVAQEAGIRYIAQHKNIMAPEAFVSATVAISQQFKPVAEDERMIIYQLW